MSNNCAKTVELTTEDLGWLGNDAYNYWRTLPKWLREQVSPKELVAEGWLSFKHYPPNKRAYIKKAFKWGMCVYIRRFVGEPAAYRNKTQRPAMEPLTAEHRRTLLCPRNRLEDHLRKIDLYTMLSKMELTEKELEILRLRFWEHKGQKEIGETVGISRQAVSLALNRIIKRCRMRYAA